MNIVRDQYDCFAGAENLIALGVSRGASLKVELALERFQFVEVAQIFG